jgi:hypothetical protein
VHRINSKIVKSAIMILTSREKSDVTDIDMSIG